MHLSKAAVRGYDAREIFVCKHPLAHLREPEVEQNDKGRWIGSKEETPPWCPLK